MCGIKARAKTLHFGNDVSMFRVALTFLAMMGVEITKRKTENYRVIFSVLVELDQLLVYFSVFSRKTIKDFFPSS